jgi:hypothetical protein
MSNGMPLVIENRTKNDVSIYATAIHDSIQNVITTDSLPGQMPILQSRGLKIIIEYTGANIYANNTRTIDRTTAAIPYEFLSSISEPNPRDNSDFNNAIAYSMYNTSQIAMQKFLSPEDTQRRLVLFLPNGRISA